jgi:hypothetical protein
MGRGFVRYSLPESGRDEWVLFSAFLDYRLADGTRLHVEQDPAWCPACRAFVAAERVPTVEELEREVAEFQAGDPDLLRQWAFVSGGQTAAGRIAELRRRVEWRRGRRSPARCLRCGGGGVAPLPVDGEFRHPQTGERVVVGGSGWADAVPWFAEFSPEGKLLAEPDAAPDRGATIGF